LIDSETWIPYRLAEDAIVKVSIYDSKGRIFRTIHLGHQPAGNYLHKDRAVYWDGRNNAGEKVASGIYYYQLQAGRFSAIRKLVVQK
jgi:flagellar hook assembly protein FlgD